MRFDYILSKLGGFSAGFVVTLGIAFVCGALVLAPFSGHNSGLAALLFIIPLAITFLILFFGLVGIFLSSSASTTPGISAGVTTAIIALVISPIAMSSWNAIVQHRDDEISNLLRTENENNWRRDATKIFIMPNPHFSSLEIIGEFDPTLIDDIALATKLKIYRHRDDRENDKQYVSGSDGAACDQQPAILDFMYRLSQGLGSRCIVKLDGPIPVDAVRIHSYSSGRITKFEISEIKNGERTVIDSVTRGDYGEPVRPDLNCKPDQKFERCLVDNVLGVSVDDLIKILKAKPESTIHRRLETVGAI